MSLPVSGRLGKSLLSRLVAEAPVMAAIALGPSVLSDNAERSMAVVDGPASGHSSSGARSSMASGSWGNSRSGRGGWRDNPIVLALKMSRV